ncbi:hypothetical protein LT85_1727 [Collimonas arenae]|uniref:Outer membrane protein TolC n=1 Tax=Collimonas arenae TaxID=279058 RepID=A0A0A1FAU0_9BURK|nr:TolC family protein [Collimonas arenae]AIY40885.1 hypothetical protein LT85_1727 [Collimonas arenae]
MTDVAILAVVNNPDLKLARDDVHIAQAQAFSASLLPDPQLALSADFKLHPDPGSSRGYSIGPSYDFGSLLTRSTIRRAAEADAGKADLNLLWQEWQVIAQARMLFIKLTQGAKLQEILQRHDDFLQLRASQSQEALRQGLITSDIATVFLTASQDLKRQSNELQRQQNQARHDLNALLGLAPSVAVRLHGTAELPALDTDSINRILPSLAARRPDLMALKSGYAAEDQRYRAAIIGQFPALTIGLTRARDTSNVSSRGFNVSLSLPIFNRNRGNIAIEQATREKLHDEYQQRVNLAYSDIDKLLTEQEINRQQMSQVMAGLQQLQQQRERMLTAFQARNVDALMLTNLDTALLAKQTEKNALEQAMLEQRVALQSLIGGELPTQSQGKS